MAEVTGIPVMHIKYESKDEQGNVIATHETLTTLDDNNAAAIQTALDHIALQAGK